jgi:hypothetical protein
MMMMIGAKACFWGAQAASLQLPAACRQRLALEVVLRAWFVGRCVSASCRDVQAGSLRSPE